MLRCICTLKNRVYRLSLNYNIMDKYQRALNNWLDEVEGKEPETTNKAIDKEVKRQQAD